MGKLAASSTLGSKYGPDFQKQVVRHLLQSHGFRSAVSGVLKPEHFDTRVHRWLTKTAAEAVERDIVPDAAYLTASSLRAIKHGVLGSNDVAAVSKEIANASKPVKNRTWIEEEVGDFLRHQQLRSALRASVDLLDEGKFAEIGEQVSRASEFMVSHGEAGVFVASSVKKRINAKAKKPVTGIPTGLPLDQYLTPGGLPRGRLGVVLAPPGRGKTLALVNIGAAAIHNGKKVLFVSLELGQDDISDRFDAFLGATPLGEIVKNRSDVESAYADIQKKYGDVLHVKEFLDDAFTVGHLKAYMRTLEVQHDFIPDVVIIDYADTMDATTHYDSRWEEIGRVYLELRRFAAKFKVVVWTASQTTRQALEVENIDLDAMGLSFEKAKIADFVFALCQTDKERLMRLMRLYICKSRFGPDHQTAWVSVDGDRQTLTKANPPMLGGKKGGGKKP